MIGAIGDLLEDVVVRLRGPVNVASDTAATIARRRGGSAANVAVSVVNAGSSARFMGQVGSDVVGERLVQDLVWDGVEVVGPRAGRTGTVVALVDEAGERTMLTDRGAAVDLDAAEPAWVDGLDGLHVPFYSLSVEPLRSTTRQVVEWARADGVMVSVDASSVGVLEEMGRDAVSAQLTRIDPDVVLANQDEAEWLGDAIDDMAPLVVVKRGPRPALVIRRDERAVEVAARPMNDVRDTTGAGDAFAAGLLVALASGEAPEAAAEAAHAAAAQLIARLTPT